MLRRMREVMTPVPLLYENPAGTGAPSAVQRIVIQGVDPRLVLVPRLWARRIDALAPAEKINCRWSCFSLGADANGAIVILSVVEGFDDRKLGGAAESFDPSTRSDGVVPVGDNAEIKASTPILIAVRSVVRAGRIETPRFSQSIWFGLDAYPADPSVSPEDFEGLIRAVRSTVPPPVEVAGFVLS